MATATPQQQHKQGTAIRRRRCRSSAASATPALPLLLLLPLVAAAALLAPGPARASEGDASPAFWSCVRRCAGTGCVDDDPGGGGGGERACSPVCAAAAAAAAASSSSSSPHPPLPLALRVARWDCAADCKYLCMWAAEGRRRRKWEQEVVGHQAAADTTSSGTAAGDGDPSAAATAAAAAPVERPSSSSSPAPPAAPFAFQTYKYFGKWPFTRVLGAQEIGSVLTSLANLAAVAHNLVLYTRALRKAAAGAAASGGGGGGKGSLAPPLKQLLLRNRHPYPYALLWYAHGLLACNAWLWSAVFHARDTRPTERLDYFSAGALVAAGLATAAARASGCLPRRPAAAALLAAGAAAWWLSHVRYMSLVKFDYGYNMAVCIALGVAQAGVWLAFLLLPQRQLPPLLATGAASAAAATAARRGPSSPPQQQHPGRRPALLFLAAIHAAMLLEVLDFPPLFFSLVDAHCLWHAATAPLTYLWWRFLLADVAWLSSSASAPASPSPGGEAGERGATAGGGGGVGGYGGAKQGGGAGGGSSPGGGSSGGDQEAGVERRRRRV